MHAVGATGTVTSATTKTNTPTVQSSIEKLHVTHYAMRSHPNTVGHVRRFERQYPPGDPLVTQRTRCALTGWVWRRTRWLTTGTPVVATRLTVDRAKTLVVVCPRPRWHWVSSLSFLAGAVVDSLGFAETPRSAGGGKSQP